MKHMSRAVLALLLAFLAIAPLIAASGAGAQSPPNSYQLLENWAQIPASMNGGKWGEVIGVKPGPDGSIWVLHRCFNVVPPGSATCVGPCRKSPGSCSQLCHSAEPQLINSVAAACSVRGITRPRALAALRLMIISNLFGP